MIRLVYLVLIALAVYLLYLNGYLLYQKKTAAMFFGRAGGKRASFTLCTGEIRRVLKLREAKVYRFSLKADITEGSFEADILDKNRQVLATLTPSAPQAYFAAQPGTRYYLRFLFRKASGSYELDWQ